MVANNTLLFRVLVDLLRSIRRGPRLRRSGDVSALYGIVAFGFGAAVVFAGGARELSRRVASGELDGYLTLPKSPLLHLVASRTAASGWGDMASGAIFIAASGMLSWRNWPLALIAVASSGVPDLRRHRGDPPQPRLLAGTHGGGRETGVGTSSSPSASIRALSSVER